MENTPFTVKVDGVKYTVKAIPGFPPLYDVSATEAFHRIGKTDAGLWVYIESAVLTQNMPVQQIGEAIEEYLRLSID